MRIEGYMMIKWRGQFRFAVDVFNNQVSEFELSNRDYDYLWDCNMRGRPTLYEMSPLPYDDLTTYKTREMYSEQVVDALKRCLPSLKHTKLAKFQQNIHEGNVEFVVVS